MLRIVAVSISLSMILLAGCGGKRGSKGVLSGTVAYNGKPVNGAMLKFYSTGEKPARFDVPVTQEGTFRTDNAVPGEYKVVVEPARTTAMPSMQGMDKAKAEEAKKLLQSQKENTPTIAFPEKYKSITTTDLKCNIANGEQKLDLVLKD